MNLKAPVFAFYPLKLNHPFPGVLNQVWIVPLTDPPCFKDQGSHFSSSLPLGLEFLRLKMEVSPPQLTWGVLCIVLSQICSDGPLAPALGPLSPAS